MHSRMLGKFSCYSQSDIYSGIYFAFLDHHIQLEEYRTFITDVYTSFDYIRCE